MSVFTSNNPSVAIWAMFIACMLPFIFAIVAKLAGGFTAKDNQHPREFLATLKGMPARANAAQQNSFESLPMFLASVLVAMLFFAPQSSVNTLACFYVIARVLYGLAYIMNVSILRSSLWFISMGCIGLLFYLAILTVSF